MCPDRVVMSSVLEAQLIELFALPSGTVLEVPQPPVPADAGLGLLAQAVEQLVGTDPATLPESAALRRASRLIALQERLQAAVLDAVADVDARELFAGGAAGSTRPGCGSSRPVTAGSWRRPAGSASTRRCGRRWPTGSSAARPRPCSPRSWTGSSEQVEEPQVLDVAFGGTLTRDQRTAQQRQLTAELDQVVRQALTDTSLPPAQRLEPAFVLLARALPVGHLAAATAQLLDALAPQAVADRAEQDWQQRSVRLVKKRFEPGWRLIADLTDEHGAALNADLDTRIDAAQAAADTAARRAAASARHDQPEQDAAADRVQDTAVRRRRHRCSSPARSRRSKDAPARCPARCTSAATGARTLSYSEQRRFSGPPAALASRNQDRLRCPTGSAARRLRLRPPSCR